MFFEKYPDAKSQVLSVYERMTLLQELPNEEGKLIYAMVTPEVAMYNELYDMMETGASEIFYSNFGGEYGNFSLGIFQMKPSFAESIEKKYQKVFPNGKYASKLKYSDTGAVEVRDARVDRLKSEEWQQVYLICCYRLLDTKFKNTFSNVKEKIKFFAAAYNYGWESSYNEINQWKSKVSFPGRGKEHLIAYADLSLQMAELFLPASFFIEKNRVEANVQSNTELIISKTASEKTLKEEKKSNSPDPKIQEANSSFYLLGILALAFGFLFFKRNVLRIR